MEQIVFDLIGRFLLAMADENWPSVWTMLTEQDKNTFGRLNPLSIRCLKVLNKNLIDSLGKEESIREIAVAYLGMNLPLSLCMRDGNVVSFVILTSKENETSGVNIPARWEDNGGWKICLTSLAESFAIQPI